MEEALIKRILPHSIEAEQSVIGSMLMGREANPDERRFLPAPVRRHF